LADFESQWTAFDVDDGAQHKTAGIAAPPSSTPWQTVQIAGFEDVAALYLTNSAWVSLDNIVLEVIPEPSTGLLLDLGMIGLALRRRFARQRDAADVGDSPACCASPASVVPIFMQMVRIPVSTGQRSTLFCFD